MCSMSAERAAPRAEGVVRGIRVEVPEDDDLRSRVHGAPLFNERADPPPPGRERTPAPHPGARGRAPLYSAKRLEGWAPRADVKLLAQ